MIITINWVIWVIQTSAVTVVTKIKEENQSINQLE